MPGPPVARAVGSPAVKRAGIHWQPYPLLPVSEARGRRAFARPRNYTSSPSSPLVRSSATVAIPRSRRETHNRSGAPRREQLAPSQVSPAHSTRSQASRREQSRSAPGRQGHVFRRRSRSNRREGGSSQGCSVRSFAAWALPSTLRPNPSLERTHAGKAHRPPSAEYHVALVGRCASPARSSQLKR